MWMWYFSLSDLGGSFPLYDLEEWAHLEDFASYISYQANSNVVDDLKYLPPIANKTLSTFRFSTGLDFKNSCFDFRGQVSESLLAEESQIYSCDFRGAKMQGAVFVDSKIYGHEIRRFTRSSYGGGSWDAIQVVTSFASSDLSDSNFSKSSLRCDFRDATLERTIFDFAILECIFTDVKNASFRSAQFDHLCRCMFQSCQFDGARLSSWEDNKLDKVEFRDCSMAEVELSSCIWDCNFRNCDLRRSRSTSPQPGSRWRAVVFEDCNLENAQLEFFGEVEFRRCQLSGATIRQPQSSRYGDETVVRLDACTTKNTNFDECAVE